MHPNAASHHSPFEAHQQATHHATPGMSTPNAPAPATDERGATCKSVQSMAGLCSKIMPLSSCTRHPAYGLLENPHVDQIPKPGSSVARHEPVARLPKYRQPDDGSQDRQNKSPLHASS